MNLPSDHKWDERFDNRPFLSTSLLFLFLFFHVVTLSSEKEKKNGVEKKTSNNSSRCAQWEKKKKELRRGALYMKLLLMKWKGIQIHLSFHPSLRFWVPLLCLFLLPRPQQKTRIIIIIIICLRRESTVGLVSLLAIRTFSAFGSFQGDTLYFESYLLHRQHRFL